MVRNVGGGDVMLNIVRVYCVMGRSVFIILVC